MADINHPFENETVLPDDYPIYGDYLYVAAAHRMR